MKKILVIQTWGIGDMVMTTPMLQILRAAWPRARVIVVAGSVAAGDVIRGSNLCDEVRVMSFRNRSLLDVLTFFVKLRFERFDAGIVASRLSSKIAFLLRFLSGLKVVAGDGIQRGFGYTHWHPANAINHRTKDNIEILRRLLPNGATDSEPVVTFHLDQSVESDLTAEWRLRGLEGHVVLGVHPGCGLYEQDKKLPEDWCWKIILRFLSAFPEGKVALFFGPEDSVFRLEPKEVSNRVIRIQDAPLSRVASLIARTNVFLSGDTGLGHVAAAVGVPVVTVAGPTKIDQTRPLGQKNLIVRTEQSLPCMPCYETPLYAKCTISQKCMTTVSVGTTFDAIVQIIRMGEA